MSDSCCIAIVLDGSENMKHARRLLLELHAKKRLVVKLLHAHLRDERGLQAPEDGAPFCLLTTEAFYSRSISVHFTEVHDDCQVHRLSIEEVPGFGLVLTKKTFILMPSDLKKRWRTVQCRLTGCAFLPRAPIITNTASCEPPDLKIRNSTACREIVHPFLDFPLPKPKLFWQSDVTLAFDGRALQSEEISINMLPLANLLLDAADIEKFSVEQRYALIAMVAASQITSNLPKIFESVARVSFERSKDYAKKNKKASPEEVRRARETAISVLLRAFLTDGGKTADEIGLVLLSERTNFEGLRISDYAGADLAAEIESIVDTVTSTMVNLFGRTVSALVAWPKTSRAAATRLTALVDLRSAGKSYLPRDSLAMRLFLESALRSAARRDHPMCHGFILDVGVLPTKLTAEVDHAVFHILDRLQATEYIANMDEERHDFGLDLTREIARQVVPLQEGRIDFELATSGSPLRITKSVDAYDYDDGDEHDLPGRGDDLSGRQARAPGTTEINLACAALWLLRASRVAYAAAYREAAIEAERAKAERAKADAGGARKMKKLQEKMVKLEREIARTRPCLAQAKLDVMQQELEALCFRLKIQEAECVIISGCQEQRSALRSQLETDIREVVGKMDSEAIASRKWFALDTMREMYDDLLVKLEQRERHERGHASAPTITQGKHVGRIAYLRRHAMYNVSRVIVIQGGLYTEDVAEEESSTYESLVAGLTLPDSSASLTLAADDSRGGEFNGSQHGTLANTAEVEQMAPLLQHIAPLMEEIAPLMQLMIADKVPDLHHGVLLFAMGCRCAIGFKVQMDREKACELFSKALQSGHRHVRKWTKVFMNIKLEDLDSMGMRNITCALACVLMDNAVKSATSVEDMLAFMRLE